MSLSDILSLLCISGAAFFVLACAVSDARHYLIPNKYVLGVLAFGVAFAGLNYTHYNWFSHIGAMLLIFFAGALLFNFGLLGGGDVKLMAALSLWSGLELLPAFLILVILSGGALSLLAVAFYFWSRHRAGDTDGEVQNTGFTLLAVTQAASVAEVAQAAKTFKKFAFMKLRVPYGIAIAAGSVYVFVRIVGQLGISVG